MSENSHGWTATKLGKFRNDVAFVARTLIRARAIEEPRFLSEEQFREWGLAERKGKSEPSVAILLTAAKNKMDEIWHDVGFCESGGYCCSATWEEEGELGQVKTQLCSFVDPVHMFP
ncbi:MAG: hypothetical protein K1X57_21570, partial [Gemmataceae bacterium]|nr:hypothetical protein [Gemmataceae bacterium]